MEDRIARAMAMDAAEGGSVDAYTRAETDALLDRKVDAVQGKGLSENDYTDAEKAKLAGSAPQATTYTKAEVDTALAAKLNTADVDDTLSGTSTNPVQNKAVQALIARLVDAEAKNLLNVPDQTMEYLGISYIVKDGIISASGTATGAPSRASFAIAILPPGEYVLSGCPANGSDTTYRLDLYLSTDGNNYTLYDNKVDRGDGVPFTISERLYIRPTTRLQNGYVASNLVFKPMICTAEDYKISQEFVPYAPSNRELYEMILALQNAQNGG